MRVCVDTGLVSVIPQSLKTGASLKSGDELKVSENAYLGLVHVSGKPLELKTAGSYKVADLAAKMGVVVSPPTSSRRAQPKSAT